MKLSCIPLGLALAGALALSSSGAYAGNGALKPLSDTEMSSVYGQGLTTPTLVGFGALSSSEQGNAYAAASATDTAAALAAITADNAQNLDRQMAQQRVQTATTGLQTTMKLADTVAVASQMVTLATALTMLGAMQMPGLFGMPVLPPAALAALNTKH